MRPMFAAAAAAVTIVLSGCGAGYTVGQAVGEAAGGTVGDAVPVTGLPAGGGTWSNAQACSFLDQIMPPEAAAVDAYIVAQDAALASGDAADLDAALAAAKELDTALQTTVPGLTQAPWPAEFRADVALVAGVQSKEQAWIGKVLWAEDFESWSLATQTPPLGSQEFENYMTSLQRLGTACGKRPGV